jgi:hypothetical protein
MLFELKKAIALGEGRSLFINSVIVNLDLRILG